MLLKACSFFLLLSLDVSFGVIYQLNDTEYQRLPRLFELDNYETCIERPDWIYCVAHLELYNDTQSDLYSLIQEYSQHYTKHYNYSIIDRGVCLTRKCQDYAKKNGLDMNGDIRSVLEGCLSETVNNEYGLRARLQNFNCNKQTDKMEIDNYDYLVLIIFIVLLMLVFVGSFREYRNQNKSESDKGFLLCFSIFRNYKKLDPVVGSDSRINDLEEFHFIRIVANFFVVYSHVMMFMASGFTSDPHTFEKTVDSLLPRFAYSSLNIVQTFFCMSGFLLAYLLQIAAETYDVTWKKIPFLIFQRWWRLTPTALMTLAFTATWMRHLGSGPLWDTFVTYGPSQQCRQYFWAHLLYYNNYLPEDTLCVFQSWHLAADLQVFIVGLIVHFSIRNRSNNVKIITLSSLTAIGLILPAVQVWLQDLDGYAMITPELFRTIKEPSFAEFHVLGHNNLLSFVVGMALSYWYYSMQQKKVDFTKYKVIKYLNTASVITFGIIVFSNMAFFYDGVRPSLLVRVLCSIMNKLFFAVGNVFLLMAYIFKASAIPRFVSNPPLWTRLSKLSYSVYLIHTVFSHMGIGSRTQLAPVSFLTLNLMFLGVTLVCFLLAVPFYLLIEAPANELLKLVMSQKIKPAKKEK